MTSSPLLWFPVLVLAVGGTLTLLNLNGSSLAILSPRAQNDPHLLIGAPRIIRADEAALSTPTLVGNVRRGLPTTPWIGLSPTFLPATALGAPAAHWTEAFKPQDWGLFVLGLARGFAWHWWSQLCIGALGLFALLVTVTRRPWTSAALATVGTLSPYVAWWSLSPGLVLGYLSGAAALALLAVRTTSTRRAVGLALGAAYCAAAGFLLLYPPWQVSLAWVLIGLLAGAMVDSRVRLGRILVVGGSAALVLGVVVVAWYVQARSAIAATTATLYPGHRLSTAASGNVAWLFDQPSSPWVASAAPRALRGATLAADGKTTFADQSEVASTWLPLPVLVLLVVTVVVVLVRRSRKVPADDDEPRQDVEQPLLWTTIGVAAAAILLLAWTVLPLPAWFGRLTLLDRVPGIRTPLALGLAALLLVAIGSTVLRQVRWSRLMLLGWLAAAAATAWLSVWASLALPWDGGRTPPVGRLTLLAVVLAVAFSLVAAGRALRSSLAVLIVVAFGMWVVVNPFYRGLGPLVNDPLVRAMEPLAKGSAPARVAVFGPPTLASLVQSSGVISLSGLTVYPDKGVWQVLDPSQPELWNNYAKFTWVADATARSPRIQPVGPRFSTAMNLFLDPCSSAIRTLHIDWVLSDHPLTFSCLTPVDTVKRPGQLVYRYRMSPS